MIDKEVRKSTTGMRTVVYKGHNCYLKFFSFVNEPVPGSIKYDSRSDYSPTALATKTASGWVMDITLPKVSIQPDKWPWVKNAVEDMLAFWEEVVPLLD